MQLLRFCVLFLFFSLVVKRKKELQSLSFIYELRLPTSNVSRHHEGEARFCSKSLFVKRRAPQVLEMNRDKSQRRTLSKTRGTKINSRFAIRNCCPFGFPPAARSSFFPSVPARTHRKRSPSPLLPLFLFHSLFFSLFSSHPHP